MKKITIIIFILAALFFLPVVPQKQVLMCIQGPCPSHIKFRSPYKILRQERVIKTGRDNTSRKTWVSLKVIGTEKTGQKEIAFKSADGTYSRRYKVETGAFTLIPQNYPGDRQETDTLLIILNPGSYTIEQFLDGALIKTTSLEAEDSLEASQNVKRIELTY